MKTTVAIIFSLIAAASFAQLKERQQRISDSIKYYTQAIESNRSNAEFYMKRGSFYAAAGSHFSALADLTRAIELAPKNYQVYFERSRVYFDQQRPEKALADINKAIELDSTRSVSYIVRGAVYSAMLEHQKALQDLSKAVALDKNSFTPYLARAAAYYSMENIDDACSDYQIVKLFIDKGSVNDTFLIAEVKARVQDICDTSRASYYYQRGIGLYNLNEYKKAVEMYERGLKRFPQNSMMLSFAGKIFSIFLASFTSALVGSLHIHNALHAEINKHVGLHPQLFIDGQNSELYMVLTELKPKAGGVILLAVGLGVIVED